jgi:hypothetical protein
VPDAGRVIGGNAIPVLLSLSDSFVVTASGRCLDLLISRPEDVKPIDVAHALSNVCRFGGHVREFYSVAQHSVLVSRLVPPGYALAGLLHDAAEAYVGDLVRPLKALLQDFAGIEARVAAAVAARFGVDPSAFDSPEVRRADTVALLTERRDLLPEATGAWAEDASGLSPDRARIQPRGPRKARAEFLQRLHDLTTTPHRDVS